MQQGGVSGKDTGEAAAPPRQPRLSYTHSWSQAHSTHTHTHTHTHRKHWLGALTHFRAFSSASHGSREHPMTSTESSAVKLLMYLLQ